MGYGTVMAAVLVCAVVLTSLVLLADTSFNVAVDNAHALSAMAELEGDVATGPVCGIREKS